MRCEDIADFLAAAADGSGVSDVGARRHVEGCLRCQAELVQYRKLLRALATLRSEVLEPAPGLLTDILATISAAGERQAVRSLLGGRGSRTWADGRGDGGGLGRGGGARGAHRQRRYRRRDGWRGGARPALRPPGAAPLWRAKRARHPAEPQRRRGRSRVAPRYGAILRGRGPSLTAVRDLQGQ